MEDLEKDRANTALEFGNKIRELWRSFEDDATKTKMGLGTNKNRLVKPGRRLMQSRTSNRRIMSQTWDIWTTHTR